MENLPKLNAASLRIGNLVEYQLDDDTWQLNKIDAKDLFWLEEEYRGQNHRYRPIPLTEEWLLKFGAEYIEFNNGMQNQYRIGNRLFVIRDGFIVDYASSKILKYVHTFQNFIFALTETESTYERPTN